MPDHAAAPRPEQTSVDERLDRIEKAIHAMAWWLVQAQTQSLSTATEVARLREALKAIADMPEPIRGGNTPAGTQCWSLKDTARAALARDPSQDRETPALTRQGAGAQDDLAAPASPDAERLRGAIEDYLLWEPGKAGHAAAHKALAAAVRDPAPSPASCHECGRPVGTSHLGTCSGSLMRGGTGIVGVRPAPPQEKP